MHGERKVGLERGVDMVDLEDGDEYNEWEVMGAIISNWIIKEAGSATEMTQRTVFNDEIIAAEAMRLSDEVQVR